MDQMPWEAARTMRPSTWPIALRGGRNGGAGVGSGRAGKRWAGGLQNPRGGSAPDDDDHAGAELVGQDPSVREGEAAGEGGHHEHCGGD